MNKIISTLLFTSLGTFLSGGVVTLAMMANHQPLSAATLELLSITSGEIEVLGFTGLGKGANDCSGFFGQGFDKCDIGHPFDREISKIIAKFEYEEDMGRTPSKIKINESHFPTVTGDEFKINFDGGNGSDLTGSGTWSYERGENDPGVRYWVAKGGPHGFELFWKVDESFTKENQVCDLNNNEKKFSVKCLRLAEAVTSGTWNTPKNGEHNLSHLSFYNGEREVPEPSLILGLLSLGLMTFSKGSSKSKNCQK